MVQASHWILQPFLLLFFCDVVFFTVFYLLMPIFLSTQQIILSAHRNTSASQIILQITDLQFFIVEQ